MTTDQVKNLQTQLNAKGANLKVDGILGPKTQAAMQQFANSVSTVTTPTNGMSKNQVVELQNYLNTLGAGLTVDGVLGPKTTSAMNSAIAKSLSTNPATANLVTQNDPESIVNAYMTGNWSGINDITGKPFSQEQIDEATRRSEAALAPAYEAQAANDVADVENRLGSTQDQYKSFLRDEEANFKNDKEQQDQTAADNGVLFSGSRYQKLNNLTEKYNNRQTDKFNSLSRTIGDTARDYQYKYGDDAASKLSDYYKLGTQGYNANVAHGQVNKSPTLSSVYNTGAYKFQGTVPVANKANVATRAAGLLANRANKLTTYGYKTQY